MLVRAVSRSPVVEIVIASLDFLCEMSRAVCPWAMILNEFGISRIIAVVMACEKSAPKIKGISGIVIAVMVAAPKV